MDEDVKQDDSPPRKRGRRGLLIGLVLAALAGGAGFYAVYAGLILGQSAGAEAAPEPAAPLGDIGFVPITPIVVSLGPDTAARHLRFTAAMEVEGAYKEDVALLLPRVLDVLNGYLRALDPAELEDRTALFRLRAQMLRRIQIVTGEGRVRDLLVTEFVLN